VTAAKNIPVPPLPLWAGRSLALIGIMMVAFNVRTAVSAISPIVGEITDDVALNSIQLGVIGTVPPIAFAFAALWGASMARRIGVERLLVISIAAMIIGHVLRAGSADFWVLLGGSVVALAGAGVGNVLLPPLVKRYFADRIGVITALYVSIVSLSAAVPSAVAAPIAEASSWRVSLGVWAIVALVCLLPWLVILVRHRREQARALLAGESLPSPAGRLPGSLWRSRVAWSIALTFSASSAHFYSCAAWLPVVLMDIAGVGVVEAGAMLGVYAAMGIPMALLAPVLASRVRNVGLVVFAGVFFFVFGYTGLLLAPAAAPWLWVVVAGCGPLLFSLALTLINLRSRTQQGSIALSGFVQGVGYGVAAAGPFIFALLREVTGGWTWPLLYLVATALLTAIAGWELRKRVFIEDELAAMHPRA
jgi:CP family cyanate transporter-like MFS transporter